MDGENLVESIQLDDANLDDTELAQQKGNAIKQAQATYNKQADQAWFEAVNSGLPDKELREVFTNLKTGRIDVVKAKIQDLTADRIQKAKDNSIREAFRNDPDDHRNYNAYRDYLRRTGGK
jgi:hypothetical protein